MGNSTSVSWLSPFLRFTNRVSAGVVPTGAPSAYLCTSTQRAGWDEFIYCSSEWVEVKSPLQYSTHIHILAAQSNSWKIWSVLSQNHSTYLTWKHVRLWKVKVSVDPGSALASTDCNIICWCVWANLLRAKTWDMQLDEPFTGVYEKLTGDFLGHF